LQDQPGFSWRTKGAKTRKEGMWCMDVRAMNGAQPSAGKILDVLHALHLARI
jgi:hypothetical protein